MPIEHRMERAQHEAVAAQRHDEIGALERMPFVERAQLARGLLRSFGRGGDERHPLFGHPPVTLICRATAGAAPGVSI